MSKYKNWKGYDEGFLDGQKIPIPTLDKSLTKDLSVNLDTKETIFNYIYYSSVHSKSRRMPYFTASNISREHWVAVERKGVFTPDDRLAKNEQLSTSIYSQLNKKHPEKNKKVDKGHLTRREDVQWNQNKNSDKALEAAKATFFYTNACPQHHQLNNEIWKYLEDAVLIRGRSKKPLKATVFTGPVFKETDPLLVFPKNNQSQIKCPLIFWKVIYYINEKNELRCAAFIMSHKLLMERDGHIMLPVKKRSLADTKEKAEKPFLMFEENEKYQLKLSLLEQYTGLKFKKAKEGLTKDQLYSKLSAKPTTNLRSLESTKDLAVQNVPPIEILGLVL